MLRHWYFWCFSVWGQELDFDDPWESLPTQDIHDSKSI